jgi:hypothetical protein
MPIRSVGSCDSQAGGLCGGTEADSSAIFSEDAQMRVGNNSRQPRHLRTMGKWQPNKRVHFLSCCSFKGVVGVDESDDDE